MTGPLKRSLLWLMLALLTVAQSPAAQPDNPAESNTPTPAAAEQPPAAAPAQPAASTLPSSSFVIPTGSDIAIIPVHGVIYEHTYESLQRRVDKAVAGGASMIVIELDTPGGLAISAMKISKYIKSLNVPTVAWVNNEAYSGGIMIAAACDEIVMSPSSSTGDCAPVSWGKNLAPTERAKALSPILEEFRDSAQVNGYDYALFHAMCVLGVEVYYIEKNDGSGERHLVNQADYAVMVLGQSTDSQLSPTPTLPTSPGTSLPVVNDVGAVTLSIATDADRGDWHPVEVLPSGAKLPHGRVHDGKTLLTLNQTRAGDIGLSKGIVPNVKALQARYAAGKVTTITPTWSEGLAKILTTWWMRLILIVVFLVGAYLEMQAPGMSVPGGVALVALILLIGAPFVIGLAEVWHILMFLLGFVFVIIELAIAPTFGVLGVIGLMMMFMGIVLSVVPSGPGWLPPPEMQDAMLSSMSVTLLALFISGIGFYFITKHFGNIPGLNRLILDSAQPAADAVGMDPTGKRLRVSGDEVLGVDVVNVGLEGEAVSELRPSGIARFGQTQVDVVTVGPYIEAGQTVKVIEVRGNRIVVDQA